MHFKLKPIAAAVSLAAGSSIVIHPASAESVDQEGIEEVTVVGQRFQNSLVTRLPVAEKELAVTLDRISETTLEDLNYFNVEDTFITLPNVTTSFTNYTAGNNFVSVRGFFADYLINNRPITQFRGSGLDRSVVESIEVLKGPTSIVFGPVAPGGIVNQVLKTPKADSFVHADITGDTFGGVRTELDLNAAELFGSDRVRGRLTLAYEDGQHPADEIVRESLVIRPVIEADLGESTRLQGSVYYREAEGGFGPYFPLNTDLSIPDEIDADTFIGSSSNDLENDYLYVEGQVVHDFLDNLTLTVRGSYLDTEGDQSYGNGFYAYYNYNDGLYGLSPTDRTGTRYGFVRGNEEEQYYFDVQLATSFELFGNEADALIGATYSDRKSFNTDFFSETLPIVDLTDPSTFVGPPITLQLPVDADGSNNEDELSSFYGEIYVRPVEWLTIPFGIRFDEVEESRAQSRFATPEVRTERDTTIKTGANVRINDAARLFYSYAESFIPQNNLSRSGFLDPERGVAHEIGIKYRAETFSIDAAIFKITREDVAIFDPNNGPGEGFFVAGGEQESEGFELSLNADLTEEVSFSFNYGYSDVEITEEIFGDIGRVAFLPRWNASAYIRYEPLDGPLRGLRGSLGFRANDERPLRSDSVFNPGRDQGIVDGYEVVELMLGYEVSDNVDLQLNVYNLTDEEYLESLGFGFGAGGGFSYGRPLNAQLRVRLKF